MPTSRVPAAFTALGIAVLTAGCIDSTTTVDIHPDGSGTVTEAVYVTRPMERMLSVMSGMAGALAPASTNDSPSTTGSVDRVKFLSRAADMGEGVRLVSAETSTRSDGLGGVRAVYAFADIRRLRLPVEPPYPIPDFGAAASNPTARVTFGFEAAKEPVVTVSIPWAEAARQSVAARQPNRVVAAVPPDEVALLRQVLDGFRMRMVVATPKGIAGSDGTFTETAGGKDARRRVLLFDIDMGALARNDAVLNDLAASGPARDLGDALGRYAGLPGLKIETRSTVKVRVKN